jgi:hypothetical protein
MACLLRGYCVFRKKSSFQQNENEHSCPNSLSRVSLLSGERDFKVESKKIAFIFIRSFSIAQMKAINHLDGIVPCMRAIGHIKHAMHLSLFILCSARIYAGSHVYTEENSEHENFTVTTMREIPHVHLIPFRPLEKAKSNRHDFAVDFNCCSIISAK